MLLKTRKNRYKNMSCIRNSWNMFLRYLRRSVSKQNYTKTVDYTKGGGVMIYNYRVLPRVLTCICAVYPIYLNPVPLLLHII